MEDMTKKWLVSPRSKSARLQLWYIWSWRVRSWWGCVRGKWQQWEVAFVTFTSSQIKTVFLYASHSHPQAGSFTVTANVTRKRCAELMPCLSPEFLIHPSLTLLTPMGCKHQPLATIVAQKRSHSHLNVDTQCELEKRPMQMEVGMMLYGALSLFIV